MFGGTLLKRLDAAAFLGFDVWEFSARSVWRAYGRLFLRAVVLGHPLRTLAGLRAYRKEVRPDRRSDGALVGVSSEAELRANVVDGDWLVGLGFCQKPLSPPCPSGRFNHRCRWLAQPDTKETPPACRACHIREVALHALPAGATIHIMTSAVDIAYDILLPALRGKPWCGVILSVCPFSIAPITLAMAICRLPGLVLPYSQGDCRDYPTWVLADDGTKLEQTFLPSPSHHRLLSLLDERAARNQGSSGFREVGNLYVPAEPNPLRVSRLS